MPQQETIIVKFRKLWPFYILQSLLACGVLVIVALVLGRQRIVLISTMAGTTMTLFAMPQAVSAKTKNVIGGHLVGFLCGAIFSFVAMDYWLQLPLAVAMTIFIMVAIDVEHPPAAGTTIALLINEVSCEVFVGIMLGVVILTQTRYYLRHHLRDLV